MLNKTKNLMIKDSNKNRCCNILGTLKFYLLLMGLWCIIPLTIQAQNIRLTTQSGVDTIRNTLGDSTVVTGNLTIGGSSSDITDLSPLYFLTEVSRNFTIEYNDMLESIVGFDSLTNIGGFLVIQENPSLRKVHAFSALRKIGGDYQISNNANLEVITGLSVLDTILGGFSILGGSSGRGHTSLDSLGDYSSLRHIGGNFRLDSNSFDPVFLGDFSMLKTIGGRFQIHDNTRLRDTPQFPRLTSIDKNISISNNDSLRYLYEFPELMSVGADSLRANRNNVSIVVEDNSQLEYCCVLTRLRADLTISGDVFISNNFEGCNSIEMSSCNSSVRLSVGDTLLLPYNSIDTTFTLYSNTRWQLSKLNPMDANWASLSSGGVSNSDSLISERDARIMVNYSPNTSGESRTVRLLISFLDTVDVATPADTLTLIQESAVPILEFQSPSVVNVGYERGSVGLTFRSNTRWRLRKSDPSVNWITMLSNVMDSLEGGRIGDFTTFNDTTVTITYERAPTSDSRSAELTLVAIDNDDDELQDSVNITITQSGIPPVYVGDIRLTTQAAVNSIRDTLGRATAITGNLTIGSSSNITHLDSLYFLTEIRGNWMIQRNSNLDSIVGFDSLTKVGNNLEISNNSSLTHISFDSLTKIGNNLEVSDNSELTRISLPALDTVGRNFHIQDNAPLDTLGDYRSLRHIGGYFKIFSFGITDLVDLGNFSMLENIGGYFELYQNENLVNVGNFPMLENIGGYFSLTDNNNLRSLYDFPALTSIGVGNNAYIRRLNEFRDNVSIVVDSNPLLEYCCVLTKIREGGLMGLGDVLISNNFEGCNISDDEDETNCNLSVRLSVGDTLLLPYNSIDTTFTLYSNTRWQLSKLNPMDADWASLSSGGVSNSDSLISERDARIMVNYSPNTSGASRTVRLLISFLDTMDIATPADTLTLIQESAVPILALQSPSAVNVGYERGGVRLTFRSNTRWRLHKSDPSVNWITMLSDGTTNVMDSLEGGRIGDFTTFNDTTVTITYERAPTSDSRSAGLTLVTIGNDDDELQDSVNITITQSGIPPVYVGNITLTTQAEVNRIRTTLGGATVITGALLIASPFSEITHLDSLYFLTEIGNNLSFQGNSILESIVGFDSLTNIGGGLFILENPSLRKVHAFSALRKIGGGYQHLNNANLEVITGLPVLDTILGGFSILGGALARGHTSLDSLGDYSSLRHIGGSFRLGFNSFDPVFLGDFSMLETIGGRFQIHDNTRLRDTPQFPRLTSIDKSISINNNDSLRYLYEFPALTSIGVGNNVYIPRLNEFRDNVSIVVEDNPLLEYCCALTRFREGGGIILGRTYVNNNFEGCKSIAMSSCNLSVRLSVDDTVRLPFFSEETVFTLYSNARWRLSKLNPGDADWVTSLSSGGVNNSDSLTLNRDARIMVNYTPNTNSESRMVQLLISFLDETGVATPADTLTLIQEGTMPTFEFQPSSAENVRYERGSVELTFRFNTKWRLRKSDSSVNWITIDSLEGGRIGDFTTFNDTTVTITYDEASTSSSRSTTLTLVAIDNKGNELPLPVNITITQNGYPYYGGNITLINQAQVDTIRNTLGRSTAIRGNLTIGPSSDITDLSPLSFLTEVTENFMIGTFNNGNAGLDSIVDFSSLGSIGGNFDIRNNSLLTYTGNFPVLKNIGGRYLLDNNDALLVAEGFPMLDTLSEIFIINNRNLESLGEYNSLCRIKTNYIIGDGYRAGRFNPSLVDLGSFPQLRTIGNHYQVFNSDSLVSIADNFPFLERIGGNFEIAGNEKLETIDFSSSLQFVGGNFIIGETHFGNNNDISPNPSLVSLDFSLLAEVGISFLIRDNDRLINLGSFPGLTRIGSYFSVIDNDSLRSLYDFPSLTSIGTGSPYVPSEGDEESNTSIVVEDNSQLEYCCTLTRLREGGGITISGDRYINNNFEGCGSIAMSNCNLSVRLADDTVRFPFFSEETAFTLYSNARWQLSKLNPGDAGWVTSLSSGVGEGVADSLVGARDTRIKVNHTQNLNSESRTVRLLISFLDTMGVATPADTLTLIQEGTVPAFKFQPSSAVSVGYERDSVELTFRFNTRWRLRKSDSSVNWITMDSLEGGRIGDFTTFNDTTVTITYEGAPTSASRSTELTLVAVDVNGIELQFSTTITITQSGIPAYTGNIALTNQAGVNTIRNTLGRATAIIGYLQIGPSNDITNLDSLYFLTEITGNFFIGGVGASNTALTNIGDFPVLQKIGGGYSVAGNTGLVHGGNFPVLESIGDKFIDSGNEDNTNQNLIGTLYGYFFIRTNPKLESLGTFPLLKRIGTSFTVRGHDSLRFLYEFPSLTNIGRGSAHVPSETGTRSNTSIVVEDNSQLEYCCVLTRLRAGGGITISGGRYINNNFEGCNSIEMSNCSLSVRLSVDDTVRLPFFSEETTFTLYSNTRWQLSRLNPGDADWVTSLSSGVGEGVANNLVGARDTRITVNYTPNTNRESRTVRLLISFLNEMDVATPADTLTLIQGLKESTLQSASAVNVSHVLGRTEINILSNVRWRLHKSEEVDWLTILSSGTTNVTDSLEGGQSSVILPEVSVVTLMHEAVPTSSSRSSDLILSAIDSNGVELLSPPSVTITVTQLGIPPRYTNNVTLRNQAEVDDIRTTLGRSIIIDANLIIEESSANTITDLSPLNFLTEVTGDFEIRENSALTHVGDFPDLRRIGGRCLIFDNNALETVSGFSVLDSLGGNFRVINNAELASLGNYTSLRHINGDFIIGELNRVNPSLKDVGSFPLLTTLGGDYIIYDNDGLEVINGFPLLTTLGGNFRIVNNDGLEVINGFPLLTTLRGNYTISNNDGLELINGFPLLDSLGGDFRIIGNDSLEVVNGFPSLDSLGGNFHIVDNAELASLGNYSSLHHINGNFIIGEPAGSGRINPSLVDLGDFSSLTIIGGDYQIYGNTILRNGGNFPMLDTIRGYFFLLANEKLKDVGSYPNLKAIGGYLSIRSTDSLRSLYDFPSLANIGTGDAYVPSRRQTISNTSIVVEYNSQLEYCCVLTRLREGGGITISGSTYISNNFEGCNISDDGDETNCNLSVRLSVEKTLLLPYSSINTTFTAYSNAQWRLSKLNPGDADWVTSLASGGVSNSDSLILDRDATITLTYSQNLSDVSRTAKFLISFLDTMGNVLTSPVPDTLTLIQEDQRPKIRLISPNENINIPYHSVEPINITFAIGGTAANWTRSEITYTPDGNENFITINPISFVQMGIVMIELTPTVNTGAERMAVFTLYPAGRTGISVTITITQAGAPPTLMLSAPNIVNIPNTATTTSDSVEIEFTVGGGATGWWATVIDGDKFLTLESDTTRGSAGTNIIRVTATENTGGARMDTVIITTMGGFGASLKDTVVITQAGASIQAPNDTTYVGNIIVITQEQVDALLDTLAGKTIIDGNLTIGHTNETSRSNITNVTPLSNIVRITGYVRIQQNGQLVNLNALNNLQSIGESFEISDNDTLTTLGNFSALQTIGGGFGVRNNAKLPTLGDFTALQSIGEYFEINNNDTLTTLGNFTALQTIGGGFRVKNNATLPTLGNFSTLQSIGEYFEIKNNAKLPTLGDFSTLQSIGGYFNVNNNDTLTTLGNFSTLQSIGGYFNVNDNDTLTTLGNFSALQSIGGDFSVFANDELATLGDFTALQTIGENFEVNNNDTLTTLGNFPALQSIEGYFSVFANDELATLGDFTALDSIRGYFNVDNNDTLTTLGNFPLLQTIGGVFNVLRNDRLTNLGDFPALVSIGMNDSVHISSLNGRRNDVSIVVEENPILFTCCVLTEFLPGGTHAVNGQIFINSNAMGCNSESEINATTLTLTSSNESITHNDTNPIAIDFIVGCGATGWTSAITYTPANANFITLSSTEGTDQTGAITIMATPTENTDVERSATITISTVGGTGEAVDTAITIVQEAGPPKLTLTSGDAISIATPSATISTDSIGVIFTVGGGASGWMAEVIDRENVNNFLTLSKSSGLAVLDTIKVAVSKNTGLSRMDTIVITTRGGFGNPLKETIVVTQAGAPPMLRLTSNNRDTLAHDAEAANAITFNIGGGAEGWSSEITYSEGADEFITLTGDGTMRGDVRVTVASKVNTGMERTATIRILTVGGTGDAVDTVITIIQEAIPTIVVTDPSDGMLSIDYNDTVAQTITFDVGGSATGWKSSIVYNPDPQEGMEGFITLDPEDSVQTGPVMVMATPTENTSVRRTATITFITTGQLGDSVTAEVTIMQNRAPGAALLDIISPSNDERDTVVAYMATILSDSLEIVFKVEDAMGWVSMISYGTGVDDFVTLSDTVNDAQIDTVRIKAAVMENEGVERIAMLTLSTTGQSGDSATSVITIIQRGAPPMLRLTSNNRETLAHDAEEASDITFNIEGGATGWMSDITYGEEVDGFITLTGDETMRGDVSVTVASEVNTDVERSATIIISTVGGTGEAVDTVITIVQEAGPPKLTLTSDDEVSITTPSATISTDSIEVIFTVGGGASGWMAEVRDRDNTNNFLTLSKSSGLAVLDTIKVAVLENTGLSRMDTIVITTRGGFGDPLKETTVITQAGGPPMLRLTSNNRETLAHDAEAANAITFNVDGGAERWSSEITYSEGADEFITLTGDETMRGDVRVTVASEVNTGVERSAVITISTVGGTGDAATAMIEITQEAVPTIVVTEPNDGMITIDYNNISAQTITFDVGGSARGWTASSDRDFVTLDNKIGNTVNTGLMLMATFTTVNNGAARTATITISTTGQLGMAKTTTVLMTQREPTVPLLTNLNFTDGDSVTIAHNMTTETAIAFDVGGNATGWTAVSSNESFITVDPAMGIPAQNNSVTATPEGMNTGVERSATITISTEGPETTTTPVTATLTITQDGAPPMLMLTSVDETIDHDAEAASDIIFNVGGGATGWVSSIVYNPAMSAGGEEFITLTGDETMRGDVTVTVASDVNTDIEERTATITITTVGGTGNALSKTVTITQRGILPTLTLNSSNAVSIFHTATSSTDSIEVIFTVGGGATGWTTTLPENSFLTLSKENGLVGMDTIKVAANENRGTEARMDTIVITAVGMGVAVVDTIIVTQGAMPTLELTSHNDGSTVSIAYDMTTPITIEFTVGGGATGWTSSIVYNPELPVGTEGFITLTNNVAITGPVVVTATPTKNNGAARTATISFFTTGGSDRVTANKEIMIVQRKFPSPPALTIILPNQDITIGKDDTTSITIEFTVGGSATAWTANTDNPFITLNPTTGDAGSNITITATPEANTEATARTATITMTTMGGVGDDASETVNITQSEGTPPLKVSPDNSLTLYPNPTTGKLTIEGISGDVQIYLHDFVGKEVFTSSLTSSRNTIDLSHLPSGMYVITLQREDKTMTEVLIIVN